MLAAVHRARELAEGHEALCVSPPAADLDAAPVRRGQAAVARPAAAAVLAGLADLAGVRRRRAGAAAPTASPPGGSDADRRPAHEARLACAASRALVVAVSRCWRAVRPARTRCETGRTSVRRPRRADRRSLYDPPSSRGTVRRGGGAEPAPTRRRPSALARLPGRGRRAQHVGLVVRAVPHRGAGPAVRRHAVRTVAVLGINVRDDAQAARDFSATPRASPTTRSPTTPAAASRALGGVPAQHRAVTVVLDKQHRVAFV